MMKDLEKAPVEIHVVDNGSTPKIELKGSQEEILLAWGWLTLAICDHYGISEGALAGKMPETVGALRNALRGKSTMYLGALEKLQREKGDGHDHDG